MSLVFSGCFYKSDAISKLGEIQSYMESYPDSALNVLKKIDFKNLVSAEEKAQYALLYSMALDKNYVDKTDFSVLQPAIDYFEKNGNPTEKLRMYYYQGRIFNNAGNDEKALECYVKGLNFGHSSEDSLTKARTYFSKALIHRTLFQHDKYAESMLEAAKLFKGKKQSSYFNALYNAHNGYMLRQDSLGAVKTFKMLADCTDSTDNVQLSKLYEMKISFSKEYGSDSSTLFQMREYLNKVPYDNIQWLTVASVYKSMGKFREALMSLNNYNKYYREKNSRYYAISSGLYENIGDMHSALADYKKYIDLSDSLDMVIFRQNTKFVEEKHNLEVATLRKSKQNQKVIFACIFTIALLAWSVFYIRLQLKAKTFETNNYRLLCSQLEHEKHALLHSLEQKWIVKDSLKEIVMQRLSLLNAIMAAAITDNYKMDRKAKSELDKLISDREGFMSSAIHAFEISHPGVIAGLRAKGLDDRELGYCCLYALGLNGKEVGEYTKMKRHYIISHSIRKKLSLSEQETNLGKYIAKLLEENMG